MSASVIGYPIVDSFLISVLCVTPIAVMSALEIKRAGFDNLLLVFRRSLLWLLRGAVVSLVVVVAAVASGAIEQTVPREIASELARVFVVATMISTGALTAAKMIWTGACRILQTGK